MPRHCGNSGFFRMHYVEEHGGIEDLFKSGCIGVTCLMLGAPTQHHLFEKIGGDNSFQDLAAAEEHLDSLDCKKINCRRIFSFKFWDPGKAGRKAIPKGSPYPADTVVDEIWPGEDDPESNWPHNPELTGDETIPFDFAFRQHDGSFIGANHGGKGMAVKIYPSDAEWSVMQKNFNERVYCASCAWKLK